MDEHTDEKKERVWMTTAGKEEGTSVDDHTGEKRKRGRVAGKEKSGVDDHTRRKHKKPPKVPKNKRSEIGA